MGDSYSHRESSISRSRYTTDFQYDDIKPTTTKINKINKEKHRFIRRFIFPIFFPISN